MASSSSLVAVGGHIDFLADLRTGVTACMDSTLGGLAVECTTLEPGKSLWLKGFPQQRGSILGAHSQAPRLSLTQDLHTFFRQTVARVRTTG